MGQVYDISLQFNGEPDEDEIVKKTVEYIANTKDHVRYSKSDLQLSEESTLLDALDVNLPMISAAAIMALKDPEI